MKLETALQAIGAPKGVTSIIEGLMNNDFSVLPKENAANPAMAEAMQKIAEYQKQLNECKSDWSYWSILSDLEYWKAIKNILEAAELVGKDNLPDVPFPKKDLVVMDAIYENTKFGEAILAQSKLKGTAIEFPNTKPFNDGTGRDN